MKNKNYVTHEQLKDEILGTAGSPQRDMYEMELKAEMMGEAIRARRKQMRITQDELGERIGVKKAQISKLEKGAVNVTIDTLVRVFKALNAKVIIKLEPGDNLEPTEFELA